MPCMLGSPHPPQGSCCWPWPHRCAMLPTWGWTWDGPHVGAGPCVHVLVQALCVAHPLGHVLWYSQGSARLLSAVQGNGHTHLHLSSALGNCNRWVLSEGDSWTCEAVAA